MFSQEVLTHALPDNLNVQGSMLTVGTQPCLYKGLIHAINKEAPCPSQVRMWA